MSAKDDVSAFNKYASTQALTLIYIDFESEDTAKAAEDFLELDVVKKSPKILTEFGTLAEREKVAKASVEGEKQQTEEEAVFDEARKVSDVKTIDELDKIGDYDAVAGDDIEAL